MDFKVSGVELLLSEFSSTSSVVQSEEEEEEGVGVVVCFDS